MTQAKIDKLIREAEKAGYDVRIKAKKLIRVRPRHARKIEEIINAGERAVISIVKKTGKLTIFSQRVYHAKCAIAAKARSAKAEALTAGS